jgi:predicted aconitase
VGLHLTENRAGQLLFRLIDIPVHLQESDDFYPVLGILIGKKSLDKIPVIAGMSTHPDEDQLKAFGAATASSGGVAMFHMIGVTPEAPTLEAAFHGNTPIETIMVTMDDLRQSRKDLTHTDSYRLDMVVLGSPHFSLAEYRRLAPMLKGKRKHSDVKFLVTSSRAMTQLAQRAGLLEPLQEFGAQITVDTCILTTPMLPDAVRSLMTNSAKFAYYAPGLLGKTIGFGSLEDCVNSAVAGEIVRDESRWLA